MRIANLIAASCAVFAVSCSDPTSTPQDRIASSPLEHDEGGVLTGIRQIVPLDLDGVATDVSGLIFVNVEELAAWLRVTDEACPTPPCHGAGGQGGRGGQVGGLVEQNAAGMRGHGLRTFGNVTLDFSTATGTLFGSASLELLDLEGKSHTLTTH